MKKNTMRLAAVMTAAVLAGNLNIVPVFAANNTFGIDEINWTSEDWASIAMTNDDTVDTGAVIRKEASADSDAAGYLYRGAAVRVIDKGEEWTQVESGRVTGYVKNEFLTYGEEARGLAAHYGEQGVTANWNDVNVFSKSAGDASVSGTLNDGAVLGMIQDNGHWISVQKGAETAGYVSEEDVTRVLLVDTAVPAEGEDDEDVVVTMSAEDLGGSADTTDQEPVYQEESYEIYVDGVLFGTDRRNVVTVDGLLPSHTYTIRIVNKSGSYEQEITTEDETILLDVRCFGAKGDGEHVDTEMIQAAIYSCPAGGTVRFPKGTYLTAPLFLKSGVTIWLEEGAELLGLTDRKEYPILPGMTIPGMDSEREYNLGSWEGNPLDIFASLITGIDVSDVNIVGRGTINGNAAAGDWWQHKKERIIAWRPRTIFLNRCKNVRIQGIKVCNSPSWTVHPYYCDGLRVMNIRISNPDDSPNTDGFDPESCTDVLLIGTEISVGDDCIRDPELQPDARPRQRHAGQRGGFRC